MSFEIGIVIFVVCYIGGRILSEKALQELSVEEKVALIDSFSGMRTYSLIPLGVLILCFFAIQRFSDTDSNGLIIGYWVLVIVYMLAVFLITYRKLKKLQLPNAYMNLFLASRAMQYLGLGAVVAVLIKNVI